ncbi:MAG: sensor histidine kinase [Flavobacteriales bacterium]|jgi:two-component sensor histidine kinase|nr:sensor histidine kinase [Flavobacteriales bacterium]MBK7942247.1 sensor histidine kinase [Flavobacteriales bacterium]MBK8949021.1 sensor histidine kinase [Flavobacteriales bacterium]MBK9701836.1 sensor histidine kinase [Flavobacteriales bacterium]
MSAPARSYTWSYLLIAVVLLAALGYTGWSIVQFPRRTEELTRMGLERTIRNLRTKVQGEFDRLAMDLQKEGAFVALHDSMRVHELVDRWQALMATEPSLNAVHLANERGAEVALLRTATGLRVRRQLEGPGHGFPVSWSLGNEAQAEQAHIDSALYDPRMEAWFSRALSERQADAVWSTMAHPGRDSTIGDDVLVSQLIRAVKQGRPFRVVGFRVDAAALVNGTLAPGPGRSNHPLVLWPDGRPLLSLPPDSTAMGRACRTGLERWAKRMDRRPVRVGEGPEGHMLQLLPFSLNGVTLQLGAIVDMHQLEPWLGTERRFLWTMLTALLALMGLLTYTFIRSQNDRRRLRAQAKRSRTQERKLAKVIGERDVLDREVHHRVKNNLQVVSSLLNMQAQRLPEGPARDEFVRGKQRIDIMALVHNKLYALPDLRGIPLDRFFSDLAGQMAKLHEPRSRSVSHEVDAAGLRCDPDQAIDLGIMLCELMSNCYQHAFPLVTGGHIDVRLEPLSDGLVRLRVRDNGRGMPTVVDSTGRLGLDVVDALAEKLDGHFTVTTDHGTIADVEFKLEPLREE